MTNSTVPEHNPARGREDRAETVQRERRRRRDGTINRMAQFKLDIFEKDQLDLDSYVYRWVNDEDNRVKMAYNDDYDFVPTANIKNYNADITNSESSERVRMLTGRDKNGNPTYSYLMAKPRDYWEADQEERVIHRENMMKGVVLNGEVDQLDGGKASSEGDMIYAASGNQLGGAAQRRRGPITRK